jgi:PEP-CTERM motif
MKTTLSVMACLLLAVSMASAGTVTSLYGDIDCFGLPGVTSCPDGSNWETGLGGVFFTDYRDPGEKASNSATDIWAAPGNVMWTMPSYSDAGALSASLSIKIAGIADINAPYTVLFDGTSIGTIPLNTNANAYQEVLTYTFSVPVALLNGADTVAIPNTAGDGFIIDYAQLDVNTGGGTIPEPATFGLLLLGVGALGAAKVRRFL